MTKIRCTLPNASEEMNGIKFAVDAGGGVVSVDAVPDDLAALFLSVPGFTAEAGKGKPAVDPAEADRLKQEKLDIAQAAKEKKAAETPAKASKPSAKDKAAAAAAEKVAAADTTTPPVVEGNDKPAATEGTDTTKPADEDGKQEGEE